jgi:hypothetical protein
MKVIEKYEEHIDCITIYKDNAGCSGGYNRAISTTSEIFPSKYMIFLQDDFFATEPLKPYINEMIKFLDERKDVALIRLRNVTDRVCNKERITKNPIKWIYESECIMVSNAHFTMNPTLAKVDVLKKIIPVKKELEAMEKFYDLNLRTGQLDAFCFTHLGIKRALSIRQSDGIEYWKMFDKEASDAPMQCRRIPRQD